MWTSALLLAALGVGSVLSQPAFKDYRELQRNFSKLLDVVLDKERYDKRIRPDFGGAPVDITVNILIKSMGEVSETDQVYTLDCYFRQTWVDRRLTFNFTNLDQFSMSWLFLDRVWKPDTFFLNGKKSHLHRITVPNKFLRLRYDGFLTYSMRLTIKARCPMRLRKFPLDTQFCPLFIGSYGYTDTDVKYHWQDTDSVLADGVDLAQYDLVDIRPTGGLDIHRGTGKYSLLSVVFQMKRRTGYYVLQVFFPCGLIVCCSWVSFWIDPDDVPGRVSMGVTTVLSMANMGFGGRAQMPKVSYATALDYFVILCFSFVFAVVVEYAAINFIDKVLASKLKPPAPPTTAATTTAPPATTSAAPPAPPTLVVNLAPDTKGAATLSDDSGVEETADEDLAPPRAPRERSASLLVVAPVVTALRRRSEAALLSVPVAVPGAVRRGSEAAVASLRGSLLDLRRRATALRRSEEDKFSRIDMLARKIFPVGFTLLLSLYWLLYLYHIADEASVGTPTASSNSTSYSPYTLLKGL